jgi:hypothetical protein
MLTLATAVLVRDWRIFARPQDSDRSLKFLRTAYVWLFVSLGMLVALPAYQWGLGRLAPASEAAQLGFSHAYYGATRHAITVGFVSLMIVGVSSKVVPTLNGVDVKALSNLWTPFVLINAGCTLRVLGQMATDWTPLAFPLAGVSGLLEVAGLAVWGTHLALIMAGMARQRCIVGKPAPPLAVRDICSADTIAAVLEDEPRLLDTLIAGGLTLLAGEHVRRTFGRVVTLRQACLRMGVDEARLIDDANKARRRFHALELTLLEPMPVQK